MVPKSQELFPALYPSFRVILLLSHCALAIQGLCWFHSTCQPSSSLSPWSFRSLLDSTFSERLLPSQFNVAAQFLSMILQFNFLYRNFYFLYFSCFSFLFFFFTVPSHLNLNPIKVKILCSPSPQHICKMNSGTYGE